MMRRPTLPHRDDQSGFTLLELIVTLAILGLALALIVGYKSPWSRSLGTNGAVADIAASLRAARAEAIGHNRAMTFEIDLNQHRFRLDSGPVHQLPSTLSLSLLTITGERVNSHIGGIRFNPDGSATGGRIELADSSRRIWVGVDWLTGRVSVAEPR